MLLEAYRHVERHAALHPLSADSLGILTWPLFVLEAECGFMFMRATDLV